MLLLTQTGAILISSGANTSSDGWGSATQVESGGGWGSTDTSSGSVAKEGDKQKAAEKSNDGWGETTSGWGDKKDENKKTSTRLKK